MSNRDHSFNGVRAWWRRFAREQWPTALRSSLFLACLTAVVGAAGHLDWLDVLALKVLPSEALERQQVDDPRFRTVVLELTQDFFEKELGGHVPVNRERITQLLRRATDAYPSARVVAVDYDLSPSGRPAPDPEDRSTLAQITAIELKDQEQLDRFLSHELGRTRAGQPRSFVTISPLPGSDEYLDARLGWQRRMTEAGVRFGDAALPVHEALGTVVKHVVVAPSPAPCAEGDPGRPFAAAVNDALDCSADGVVRVVRGGASAAAAPPAAEPRLELINFGGARRTVFTCPVWEWEDLSENCGLRLRAASGDPGAIEALFIGAAYGQEDRFRTPVGDQFGVAVHAFAAHSLRDPVRQLLPFSFAFDILIGIVSATLFQLLWGGAAASAAQSGRRFAFLCGVFGVLGALATGAVLMTPWMLNRGTWLNPLLVLCGCFADSYQGAAERVVAVEREGHPPALAGVRRWLCDFVGVSNEGHLLVAPDALRELRPEAWFQLSKKLVFYWSVVLSGLFFVASSH